MAPSTSTMEDFDFIMTCYKHFDTKPKVNFEAVATELGAKNAMACYHRHWSILKKWGMAGNGPQAGKAKRATPQKRKLQKAKVEGDDNDDDDDAEHSLAKKVKSTPRKKQAAPVKVKREEEADAEADDGDDTKANE